MKQTTILTVLALLMKTAMSGSCLAAEVPKDLAPGQWEAERAKAWHDSQPWLVGCNFLPSTAVNDVEMWQVETFDPVIIERELGWARDLGFNSVRVFLNFVAWEADPDGFKRRFRQFLDLAGKSGISVMPVLLDDCNFAGRVAAVGKQADPIPGVHNSQWVSSPPLAMVTDRTAWPRLEHYVKDLVGTFAQDRRVVVWDLYNEPGNGMEEKSRPLMEAAFDWARAMKPSQPLTVGAWADFKSPFSRRMMELSDVVSFHGYDARDGIEAKLAICAEYGRPVLCTEWLRRQVGNKFETLLPLFRERKIGCYNWGLVAGRTQTYFPWGSPQGAPEPKVWQHDILRRDGTPFSAREAKFIQVTTGKLPASALPEQKVLVPTAEKVPVPWRYTLEKPAEGWFKSEFNDSAWKQGAAPFGTLQPPFDRKPNTVWTGADIWLRREFEMPAGQFTNLVLLLHHDEDAEVYVNGVLAVKADGYNAAYETFDLSPQAQAALKPGKNTMAAYCRQTVGGQYFDVGLVADADTGAGVSRASRQGQGGGLAGLRKLMDTPLRDTSICRGLDGMWYLTGTVEPFWGFNEGIKLWKSPDLTNWAGLGFVWKYGASPWHKPYLEKKKPLWAPEVHYLKDTFWLTYSIPGWDGTGKTSGCGLLKSTTGKPDGPYKDMHPDERLGDEIDASLFQDDDGTVYFLWHSGKIARMKPDMSGLAEPYRWLKTTTSDPNPKHHSGLCAGIFGKDSFDHVGYEGMFLFKRNGRYYLSCAEHFDGRYSCTITTSTNIYGPYGARYEAIPHGGHNTFFTDERGQWWSTYFGSDATAPWQERPGVLPVEFDAEGRVRPKAQ